MKTLFNMKPLPEYGINLLGPDDSTFAQMVDILETANPDRKDELEALRPYSLVVHYTDNRSIIAYAVKWDQITSSGELHPNTKTCVSSAVVGEIVPSTGSLPSHLSRVIRPGSFWFCSPVHQLVEIPVNDPAKKVEFDSGMFTWHFSLRDVGNLTAFIQAMENGEESLLRKLSHKQLANYSSITFSFDGVLFDDGTIAGRDTSGFYDKVKSQRDARHDLLMRVANGAGNGEPLENIFSEIKQSIPQISDSQSLCTADAATQYAFYKKMYSENLLAMRSSLRDDGIVKYVLAELSGNWPEFHRDHRADE